MRRAPLLPALALASAVVVACSGGQATVSEGPRIQLTHQWGVPQGASIFVENSLGAAPAEAADRLMGALPNVVYRLGERCKGEAGFADSGALTVEFVLTGAKAEQVRVDPATPASACVERGLIDELTPEEALAGLPRTEVVLHLVHMPLTP
jgi:hypothetical protein